MGLDYSFLLYFKRDALWDALQGVAAISRPSDLPTLVVFPNHILSLSLKPWGDKNRLIKCNDPEFGFMISIYFPPDIEITDYVQRHFPDHYTEMVKESPLGIPIGYIYLTVYNDMGSRVHEIVDPDLVLMEFGTTGTRMSCLFSESSSIQKGFVNLLEKHSGVCGVLNLEDAGLVFWLKGQKTDARIPNPWLQPKEIEGLL